RISGPCAFQAARDRVVASASSKTVPPAEPLLFEGRALRFGTDELGRRGGAVGFAEGVAAGNQGHRLLIIHGHPAERLLDVPRRRERIGFAVWALRIHVDQAHLNGAERIFEHPVARVTLVSKPLTLRSPVDVRWRLPAVLTPATET